MKRIFALYGVIFALTAFGSGFFGGSGGGGGTGTGNILTINSDVTANQTLSVGTTGTDFAIADDASGGHAFNLPNASGSARGVLKASGAQTLGGDYTFSGAAPIVSALTASKVVTTDASKQLSSVTYTNANTASSIVQRDGSGNFIAGTVTANLTGNVTGAVTGNASTATTLSGVLATTLGGTALSAYTAGDILYASASNTLAALPKGTSGQVLRMMSNGAAAPEWFTSASGGIGGSTGSTDRAILTANGVSTNTLQSATGITVNTAGVVMQFASGGEIDFAGVSTIGITADTTNGFTHKLPTGKVSTWTINGTTKHQFSGNEYSAYADIIDADINTHYLGFRTADGFPYPFKSVNGKSLISQGSTVALTADNQSVSTVSLSYIKLTSNDSTAANRTFTLSAPDNTHSKSDGQWLVLMWNTDGATGKGELVADSRVLLTGGVTWSPVKVGDTITFIVDSVAGTYNELSRSLK